MKNLLCALTLIPMFASAKLPTVIVDPQNVVNANLNISNETIFSHTCFRYEVYGGETSRKKAVELGLSYVVMRPLIEGRGSCEPYIADYAKKIESDKKEKKFFEKYSFGEKIVYSAEAELSISMIDGSLIHVGSTAFQERFESFDSADGPSDYENNLAAEKNKIDALVKNADVIYFNQYGLCYRNLIELADSKASASRLKVDCESNSKMTFKKD